MSPVYPQMLEQIQQLSVNGGSTGPASGSTNSSTPVLGPRNGFFGVEDYTAR